MSRLILFNKPYGVLTQFTSALGCPTLADYIPCKQVYPAGRLDKDSEGLLALTDDGGLQARLSQPRFKLVKTYWVQVEGVPSVEALERLRRGVELRDGTAVAIRVQPMEEPSALWPRVPPIRHRAAIPTAWVELSLDTGRNRQVRRMTAAVGHPTLRLIRYRIGEWTLDGLAPGQWRLVTSATPVSGPGRTRRQPGSRAG